MTIERMNSYDVRSKDGTTHPRPHPEDYNKITKEDKNMTNNEEAKKPECQLTGTDGNVFAMIGRAGWVLKKAGMRDQATEMSNKCFAARNYDEALQTIMEYVEVS